MTHHINPLLFLLLTFFPLPSTAEIHIWEPPRLRNIYKLQKLSYTIANFGTVPYGHSIYGSVFKASPLDACTDLSPLKWEKNKGTLILYVERGTCHFAKKVLNAQKIGAGLVLIGDTNNEDVSKILPVERTTALMEQIHIPSVLISKGDAENFRNILKQQDGPMITMAVNFELVKGYDTSDIKMILQVDDFRSYDAILNLDRYHDDFKDSMSLTVHYKVFKNLPVVIDPDSCIELKDTYCVLNGHPGMKDLGLLNETLKQMCLYDHSYKEFISYLKYVRSSCFKTDGDVIPKFRDCVDNAFKKAVPETTRNTLAPCMDAKSERSVELFSANNDNIKYYLINFSPIVFINGFIFKGNYQDANHLMEAFCNSFEQPPSNCSKLTFDEHISGFSSYGVIKFIFWTVMVAVCAGFVMIIGFYVVYRKRLMKKFDSELGIRINDALSKYYGDQSDGYMGVRREDM